MNAGAGAKRGLGRAAGVALVCLGLAFPAAAASGDPEGWAYSLSNEMMSPFCPGRTLADCPSDNAESLRLWILVQESTGRARGDVEAELLERYGDVILAAPRPQGFGLAAYVIPVSVFVAGGLLVGIFLRRQTAASDETPGVEGLDPVLAQRVDEELGRTGSPENLSA